jgi:hypothetical protein
VRPAIYPQPTRINYTPPQESSPHESNYLTFSSVDYDLLDIQLASEAFYTISKIS